MSKTENGFLPDINARPNSKRKVVNLPKKNSLGMTSFESINSDKQKVEDLGGTNLNLFKSESVKEKEVKPLMKSSKGIEVKAGSSKVIVKRGLSKNKK